MIIHTPSVEDMLYIRRLFESSFPANEKAPFEVLVDGKHPGPGWMGLYDGRIVGITYLMDVNGLRFVLYLAVDEDLRCRGYGSEAISEICRLEGASRIFLDIEDPDEPGSSNPDARRRRRSFYESNGFVPCGRLICSDGAYVVMGHGGHITGSELESFLDSCRISDFFEDDGDPLYIEFGSRCHSPHLR